MTRSFSLLLVVTFSAVFSAACAQPQPAAPSDNHATDAVAVQKADADWSKAAQTKQADAWVTFYADDAVVLPPNDKMATTKDAIHKTIAGLLALPDLSLSWTTTKAEAARSGDLAYTYGTYQLAWKGAKGKAMSDKGKYSEVWKKQADGSWRCVVDMWSSDLPTAK